MSSTRLQRTLLVLVLTFLWGVHVFPQEEWGDLRAQVLSLRERGDHTELLHTLWEADVIDLYHYQKEDWKKFPFLVFSYLETLSQLGYWSLLSEYLQDTDSLGILSLFLGEAHFSQQRYTEAYILWKEVLQNPLWLEESWGFLDEGSPLASFFSPDSRAQSKARLYKNLGDLHTFLQQYRQAYTFYIGSIFWYPAQAPNLYPLAQSVVSLY